MGENANRSTDLKCGACHLKTAELTLGTETLEPQHTAAAGAGYGGRDGQMAMVIADWTPGAPYRPLALGHTFSDGGIRVNVRTLIPSHMVRAKTL